MKYVVNTFNGESPRMSPRLLPPSSAQEATNCRLGSGDIEPFRQFVNVKTLAAAAQTIYKLNGAWLSWNAQVDVSRGVIPGDTNFFAFLTSPGIYSTPRYTTYALATTGAEPYPVTTYPLGMPAPTIAPTGVPGVDPTPTSFSVDITDDGTTLASNWTTGPYFTAYNHTAIVQQVTSGNPSPGYRVLCENNTGECAYAVRNFGVATANAASMVADVSISTLQTDNGINILIGAGLSLLGEGVSVGVYGDIGSPVLGILISTSWSVVSVVSQIPIGVGLVRGTWYTLSLDVTKNADASLAVTATLKNGATVLKTLSATASTTWGDYCAFMGRTDDDLKITEYDNIHVTASGASGQQALSTTATSYLYTFVNTNVGGTGVDWESAPSPTSATLLRPDGIAVTVTTATSHAFDAGYGINAKRIYRAVSGATGDVFLFVAEIALATADYVDTLDDAVISNPGIPLETEDWDLPHASMEGIIVLPNGTMAGFFENQLCFCVVGHPHAWPIKWRLPVDSKIKAIANIDNTIVIGTETFVYTATGSEPGFYSMSKPGAAQSCVSKLSMVYLDNFGVVFASPDGMQVCSGSAANVLNSTRSIFSKPQWEALTPTSVKSAVYDGTLYFWATGPAPDSGYAIDTNREGWGLIRLTFHPTAVHVDPLLDAMFMILSVNSEPTDVLLPLASTAVTPTSTSIFQFDAHATNRMVYRWRGPLNLTAYPQTMHFAKLEAEAFANVVTRIYVDGALLGVAKVNANATPYRIEGVAAKSSYEQEIIGTSRVRSHQIASTVMELD